MQMSRSVKNWLTESNNKFSVQELQDNDSYFFFFSEHNGSRT